MPRGKCAIPGRPCRNCGAEFVATNPNHWTCCQACKKSLAKEKHLVSARAYTKRHPDRKRTSCRNYEYRNREKVRNYPSRCRERRKQSPFHVKARMARELNPRLSRECQWCGESFIPRLHRKAAFCCKECRWTAYWAKPTNNERAKLRAWLWAVRKKGLAIDQANVQILLLLREYRRKIGMGRRPGRWTMSGRCPGHSVRSASS